MKKNSMLSKIVLMTALVAVPGAAAHADISYRCAWGVVPNVIYINRNCKSGSTVQQCCGGPTAGAIGTAAILNTDLSVVVVGPLIGGIPSTPSATGTSTPAKVVQ